ncbi:MAG: cysteine peptidase family C39 domain-containing protein [Candidatus Aminicenantes bacterium]|nr:cysteine peptidase family C39 domain-containing protein [Candidatus Aminicenantes bacterium]
MGILRRILGTVFVIVAFVGGWQVRGWLHPGGSPAAAAAKDPAPLLLAGVPDVRQSTVYSCGASVLQAVLQYYGQESREDALMKECRTTAALGTQPGQIIKAARARGLQAELKEGLDLNALEAALWRKIPVICAIQAWADSEKPGFSWAKDWEDGHYVIVIGLDGKNVYVEDPSILGSRGVIPRTEFLERWHDYEGKPPFDKTDRAYRAMGIFIEGAKPVPPPPFTHVE